ncbi:MAG: hypothetical protein IPJ42_14930 [Betaproteobacteria bacterium]|jgi:hypothetical protein|nr:hypothetical protein [Betaproteobacteria bacterium]MBK7515727.1 hypothetical protein [Betaproteobacteria bacterium]MBK8106518.1 hypothetical protein [Betaproteobacteria bacterium]MBK9685294.1 hypothetical protein [Betaproteobacteria bacterium]MBL0299317.1 hypothetical protein [Betaproteobacteria bacterium]
MDRFDRVVVALGRRWSRVLRVASVGFGVLFASTIATNSAAADCSQITGWSNQDATFFPVERVTRIDRSNAPGRFYFKMDSEQEKTLLVTYFTLRAGPKSGLTKDQLFSNSVSVGLYSFGSAADANGMFNREVDTFNVINPNYWGYSVGPTGTGVLSYYSDRPGNKEFNYFAVHQNTIISIQLRSASETEDLHSVGVAEMVKRAQRARDLVDAKCGTKPLNSAPSIYLHSDNNQSLQARMAGGKITVTAYDPDGNADLDWNTFRLYVAGVDKTIPAVAVWNALTAEKMTSHIPSPLNNTETLELRVDPKKLMTEHNFFNIAWNGTWPVQLKVCDRKGACGEQSYDLYFGPFLDLVGFFDNRCLALTGPNADFRFEATWGNNGYAAVSNFYVGLSQSTQPWWFWVTDYWTLVLEPQAPTDVLYWFDWTYGILPVLVAAPAYLETGALRHDDAMRAPSHAFRKPNREPYELGPGTYSLVFGAVDLSPGLQDAYLIRKQIVTLCETK